MTEDQEFYITATLEDYGYDTSNIKFEYSNCVGTTLFVEIGNLHLEVTGTYVQTWRVNGVSGYTLEECLEKLK